MKAVYKFYITLLSILTLIIVIARARILLNHSLFHCLLFKIVYNKQSVVLIEDTPAHGFFEDLRLLKLAAVFECVTVAYVYRSCEPLSE